MNNLICDYYELRIKNLRLVHQIELKDVENRLKLEFDSQLNEFKSEYVANKEFDVSRLQNKIAHLKNDMEIQLRLFKDQRKNMVSTIENNLTSEIIFKIKEVVNQTLKVVDNYLLVENIDKPQVLQEVLQNFKTEGYKFLDEIETTEIGTLTDAEDSISTKKLKFGKPIHRSKSATNLSAFIEKQFETVPPVIDLISPDNTKNEES